MTVKHVTAKEFESEVLRSNQPVLVDFYAPWCGPCKMLTPVLEKLAVLYAGKVKILKVDTDQEPELASAFRIRGVPTLIFFVDGKIDHAAVGFVLPQALQRKLDVLAKNSTPAQDKIRRVL